MFLLVFDVRGLHARITSNILFKRLLSLSISLIHIIATSWSYIGWCMVGKHGEKNSGINSLAKCGGCKATGRIIIGSKSDINYRQQTSMGSVFRLVSVISCLFWMVTVQMYSPRNIPRLCSFIIAYGDAHEHADIFFPLFFCAIND